MRFPTLLILTLLPLNLWGQEGPMELNMGLYLQGRAVFEQQCAPCHGRTGRGDGDWAADVSDKPRNFRSGIFKFRSTPLGSLPTTADLERTVRGGISGTMMPAFTHLSEHDLKAVLTYVKSFSSKWKKAENYQPARALPEPPAWFADLKTKRQHAAQAAPLFQATCAVCHGATGKGDGPAAKQLIDVWQHAVTPADFTKPHRKSGPAAQDLYRSIALGLDGTPMTAYEGLLSADVIWALVAYVESLSALPAASGAD
jgi:mono/diheme cytochrome c family protein